MNILRVIFPPKNILNDDQIVIKKEKGSFFAFSTAFGSLGSEFQCGKLGVIFLLKKSSFFNVSKISKLEVIKFLWNDHFLYTISMPKKIRIMIFDLLWEFISKHPCFYLQFPKNGINERNMQKFINSFF